MTYVCKKPLVGVSVLVALSFAGIRLVGAERSHVYVGVGGALEDLKWIENQQRRHGTTYRPVLINPHPKVRHIFPVVARQGGTFYPNAAWTADNVELRLHMSSEEFTRGGHDSILRVRGRHGGRINVTTVDLVRVLQEHTTQEDVVVMRMDVEGLEYELLRHVLLSGMMCRISRLYVETHAMSNPSLNPFRSFDVLLPWLSKPCGTEVFVDSNYHSIFESRELWSRGDGACRQCPSLYATMPGAKSTCPSSVLPQCFDAEYTCERCCSLRKSPRGDPLCWSRGEPVGQRLASGGRAYFIPEDVFERLVYDREGYAWKKELADRLRVKALSSHIFSYEMCCAGMLGSLMPELLPFVADRSQNEAFSPENPRYSSRVDSGVRAPTDADTSGLPCLDFSGLYRDSGGGIVSILQSECKVKAENELQHWVVSGEAFKDTISLWDMLGNFSGASIVWPNRAEWFRFVNAPP